MLKKKLRCIRLGETAGVTGREVGEKREFDTG